MRETMITVAGNVGGTPTFFEPNGGQEAKLVLSMATTRRVRDRDSGEWRDGNTSWYDVWLRGRLAQNAQQSIAKGDAVIVTGTVEIRPWEDGEKSGTKAVISARSLGPDLNKYPVTISRVRVATSADEDPDAEPGSTADADGADHGSSGDSAGPAKVADLTGFAEADEDGNPIAPPGNDQQTPQEGSIVERLASGM